MPENPAGLGHEPKKLVHFSKMATPEAPYKPFYHKLMTSLGWQLTGICHIKCRTEVITDGFSEACGCGTSEIDIAKGHATISVKELPIQKLI
jgi:hypothetical protein